MSPRVAARLLPVLLLAGSPAAQAPSDPLRAAIRELEQGNHAAALPLLARVKRADPGDAGPYFFSALALADLGHLREALAEMGQAVSRQPARGDYLLVYAEMLLRAGELDDVERVLNTLEDPRLRRGFEPEGLWRLASLYIELEQFDRALEILVLYTAMKPHDPRGLMRRGQIHLKDGRFESARAAFDQVLAHSPDPKLTAAARYGRGVALFRLNRPREARQDLSRAFEQDPDNAEYAGDLATTLLALGENERARDVLLQVEDQGESRPAVYRALGQAYRNLEDMKRAREYLARFQIAQSAGRQRELTLERIRGTLASAKQHLDAGQVTRAHGAFQRVLELDADNWLAHSFLAKIYLSSGRDELAARHLDRMLAIDPEAFEGRYLTALHLYQTGRVREALPHARAALALRPGFADLRNLLGNIYFTLGDRRQAREEYLAATELEPDRQEFRLNYESALKN